MAMGLAFWILMLIWLVFGIALYRNMVAAPYATWGNTVLLFVLFLLLGWKVFGPPLQ